MVKRSKEADQRRLAQIRHPNLGAVKKRYSSTQVACNLCRSKKSACDGERPACSLCATRRTECIYDTRDATETRFQALRRQNEELRTRIRALEDTRLSPLAHKNDGVSPSPGSALCVPSSQLSASELLPCHGTGSSESIDDSEVASTLLRAMYKGSDSDSILLLARLRTGERPEDMVRVHTHQGHERKLTSMVPCATQTNSHTLEGDSIDYRSTHIPAYFDRNVWACSDRTPRPWTANMEDWRLGSLAATPCLENRFGNLSFRDAILANHQSVSVQSIQQQNLSVPYWATRTLNDPFDSLDPYETAIIELTGGIRGGHDIATVCGDHAYVAALNDPQVFARAPKLSQLTAMIIRGVKCGEVHDTLTPHALMWLHWSLLKWMLMPTQESFFAIPGIIRPLPSQLFTLHSRVLDFVFPVSLREHVVQQATNDLRWISEGCATITCEWPFGLEEAFSQNTATGEQDLSAACKSYVSDAEIWSLGPSVRPYLRNIDSYARIA